MAEIPGSDLVRGLGGVRVNATQAPALCGAVTTLCRAADVTASETWVVPSDDLNAFTTGDGPHASLIAVHTELLKCASPHELEAVVGHEIGHIVHGDVQSKTRIALGCMAARVAGSVAGSAVMHTIDDDDDLLTAGLELLGGLVVSAGVDSATNAYTTHRNFDSEFRADAYSAQLTGKSWALASLLEKLATPPGNGDVPAELAQLYFGLPKSCAFGVQTHPPIEERIARAQAVPPAVAAPVNAAEAQAFCSECGGRPGSESCGCTCGNRPSSAVRGAPKCSHCGATRLDASAFCDRCGGRHVRAV